MDELFFHWYRISMTRFTEKKQLRFIRFVQASPTEIMWMLATTSKKTLTYFCEVEKNHVSNIMEIFYPVETRSIWKAFLDCNSSSQTELAKVLPRDWNKLITEGSHTLTSSVRDLTCNSSQHKNKRCSKWAYWTSIMTQMKTYPTVNKRC